MYDNSLYVNPSIRNFWLNLRKNESPFHPFKKNKNLVFFGDDLSRNSFKFISERIEKLNIKCGINEITEYFFNIINCEKGHSKELSELAISAVSQAFEIPEDLLNANLNEDSNVEKNGTEEKYEPKNFDYESLDQSTKDQINKRILLNCVIQGASIHSFYTVHHLVKDELNNINSDLLKLYDNFSVGSVRSYYSINYSEILAEENFDEQSILGSSKVEFEEDSPKVIAHAKTFPVLCQELAKGAIETICLHGLEDIEKEELEKIYYFADKRQDEPKYIQIGTELWRRLLEFNKFYGNEINKISLPEIIMKISRLSPKNVENFFEFLLQKDYHEAVNFI